MLPLPQPSSNKKNYFSKLALWAESNDIYPVVTKLGSELWGYVFKSSYGSYLIAINKNISRELQEEVLLHEVKHILNDAPAQDYIVGFNMQHSVMEKEADDFAFGLMSMIR